MKLTKYLLICCILASPIWTFLQEKNGCTSNTGHKGQKVAIENCPALLNISRSPWITVKQRDHLKIHTFGDLTVCCDAPMISTTMTEHDYADIPQPAITDPTMITANRITKLDLTDSHQPSSVLPKENDCGLDPASQRIIGGHKTQKDQFRWTVTLKYTDRPEKGILCGGSLVNTRYVLTAAHCLGTRTAKEFTLGLGDWDTKNHGDCDDSGDCTVEERFIKVEKISIHPQYNKTRSINDIALLRMENALPENYTSHILPICMPFSPELMHDSFVDRDVSVVGWGSTNENGIRSRYKMYANLKTISNKNCNHNLSKPIIDRHICAESPDNTIRDACEGDSGGPLQIQIKGTYYLIGIVNFGCRCNNFNMPGVYTRVTSYKKWIMENIS